MPQPLSIDLRKRVVAAVLGGMSYDEAAARFRVGRASVSRWVRRHRETGDVQPAPMGGPNNVRLDEENLKVLEALVEEQPDRTLAELSEALENPQLPKARIIDLATCAFIHRHEAALLVGPTGTGKTHIAQAIGHRACRHGLTTLFTSAAQLFTDLRAARADNSLQRRLLRYTTPDLLIIDDLGLRPLRHDEPEDLYDIIRQRYRRGSIIITSNRAVAEWYPLFGDPLLASAAMDRLLHDAHIVEMQGDSYRTARRARGPE